MIVVHQFSKVSDLFKDFIEHFYELKRIATESTDVTRKQDAKLHLNTLYGMFGRKLETLTSLGVKPSEEFSIVSKYPVKTKIELRKDLTIFLIYSNVDYNLIYSANEILGIDLLMQSSQKVNSSVAIAAAITAIARIIMMKFKAIEGVNICYTDTDSLFTDKELPAYLVADKLGKAHSVFS